LGYSDATPPPFDF